MSSKEYFGQVAPQWDAMRQEFFSEGVREKAYAAAIRIFLARGER